MVCVEKWVDMIGPLSLNPRTTHAWITSCQGLIQAILFHLESWTGWKNIATSVQCALRRHSYWMLPDLVNTQLTPPLPHIYCNTSQERSEQSLLFSPRTHSSTYVSGERQEDSVPRPVVANDGPGFLWATTSILSELDDSASQRHRSVGGFLLRLGAYAKRILHHHKKKKSTAIHFMSKV